MATTTSKDVKVTEECNIIPAPNPSSEEKLISDSSDSGNNYLPLTFFDTMWLRFPPTQRLFFYEIPHLSSQHFYNTILPKLKHSLSLTLQHYPSLAGHLSWHPDTAKPIIRYSVHNDDDAGVPFSVAESCTLDGDDDFDSLSTDHFKEAKDLHLLLPDFHVSESKVKVLSIRVTLFPNHGFSIGYCAHHTSMDGKSTSMFLKSWATICRVGALTPELIPLLDRSLIHDPSDICTIFTDQWMKMVDGNEKKRSFVPRDMKPAPGLFRSTFRLTPEQIGQIKGKIKTHVSTFTAVCSHVWTCLVKAEEGDIITKETVYLKISVDCRGGEGRWDPPVPANYFGNCVTYRFAKAKVESLKGEDGLVVAAAAIREAIGSLADEIGKGVENWLSEVSSTFRNEKVYAIGGSPWFDFYGVDFGWGRPKMVEMVSNDRSGSFSLCDCRDGNGVIEIGIVLSKPKIQAFADIFAQGRATE